MDQTTTPRRRLRWAAVALLGAFSLVAGACGGDDDGGDEAASDSETAGRGEDFCQAMREIDEQASQGGEPTEEEIAAVVQRMSELDPPPEIAERFNEMVQGMQQAMLDPSSGPELAEEVGQASEEVDAYVQAECGAA
jgi:hypothetical protein